MEMNLDSIKYNNINSENEKLIILTNGEKYSVKDLNKLLNINDCSICRHKENEEYCNGENMKCDGEKNINNFSFIGIKEII
jgi:hypothetical protein